MLSPKLLSLLETFSKAELSRFKKFLESPFFNENEELARLFDIIDEYLRAQKHKQLEKEVVWKNLFGGQRYRDAYLRRLCSELLYLGYGFMYASHCRSVLMGEKLYLLEQFRGEAMEKHFRGILRQVESLYEEGKPYSSRQFLDAFYKERAVHRHLEEKQKKVEDFGHLERSDAFLDRFYYVQKLKHHCDALGYQSFLARQPAIRLPGGFFDHLRASGLLEEPLLKAYYLVAQMLSHPEEESHFRQLKKLLFEGGGAFSREDCLTLYIHLSNYCIHKKINTGRSDFFPELFDIYKKGIEGSILIREGVLAPQDYKNIITVGLYVREFEWVEHFIQQHTANLPEENQENALTYNLAKVYFHQEQYEKAIEQLREVEYKSLVYALGSKLMLLKTYFELGEYLPLDSLIESFRIYLRRKREISRDVRQQYMNVLRFVKKLSRIDPRDKEALQKVRQEVEGCNALAAKNWILEKIGEMGG